ncbi:molybdopterin converting factor subunit 1 [Limnobacter sp.]|uniref:molybdopterin converting factor subunit 1 n=1 Tax=Limnobacter sp. TaxID=2003368 RepID=UPI003519CB12
MSIKVRFFASLKEHMGCESLIVDGPFEPATVAGLSAHLKQSQPQFAKALAEVGRVRAAVNHDMADEHTLVPAGAEVAFFPPVTGG